MTQYEKVNWTFFKKLCTRTLRFSVTIVHFDDRSSLVMRYWDHIQIWLSYFNTTLFRSVVSNCRKGKRRESLVSFYATREESCVSHISNTSDSVSSGYPNTEKRVVVPQRSIFDEIRGVWTAEKPVSSVWYILQGVNGERKSTKYMLIKTGYPNHLHSCEFHCFNLMNYWAWEAVNDYTRKMFVYHLMKVVIKTKPYSKAMFCHSQI